MGSCWHKPGKNSEKQPIFNQQSPAQYTANKPDTIIVIEDSNANMKRSLAQEQPREDPPKIPKHETHLPPRRVYQPIKHEYSFIYPPDTDPSDFEGQTMQDEEYTGVTIDGTEWQSLIQISRLNIHTKPWKIIQNGANPLLYLRSLDLLYTI